MALNALLLLPNRLLNRISYFEIAILDVRDFSSPAGIFKGVNIELSMVRLKK